MLVRQTVSGRRKSLKMSQPSRRPRKPWIATIRQMTEASFCKVFDGQPRNRLVVGVGPRYAFQVTRCAEVNNWQAEFAKALPNRICLNASNDSVAIPRLQPRWRRRAAFLFGQMQRPVGVMLGVGVDSLQKASAVTI